MVAIQNQIAVLSKLLCSKEQQQQQNTSSSPRLSQSRRTSSNRDGGNQSNSGQMASGSNNLSAVELDGRIAEGSTCQDRPSSGSRNADEKSSKSDTLFENSLSNIGSDRIIERNSADEVRDQMVMEAAKEQAMESSGCTVS